MHGQKNIRLFRQITVACCANCKKHMSTVCGTRQLFFLSALAKLRKKDL